MLEVRALTKRYTGSPAFDQVSFTALPGAVTGYLGPFTCSFLPGKANLKIMFGVYWGLLIMVSELITGIEQASLRHLSSYTKLMVVMVLAWLVAARRARGARARIPALSFEEQPVPAVASLGLGALMRECGLCYRR